MSGVRVSYTATVQITGTNSSRQLSIGRRNLKEQDVRTEMAKQKMNARLIEHLYLCSNGLETLPTEICQHSELRSLDISRNRLMYLPGALFRCFSKLQRMDAAFNKLRTVPDELCRLTNLTYLSLHHNGLRTLPSSFCMLQQLNDLNLAYFPFVELLIFTRHNSFEQLPRAICHLATLTSLDVSNNSLHELPLNMGDLQSLQEVYLRYRWILSRKLHFAKNNISVLPETFKDLVHLVTLRASFNQIEEISDQLFARMTCLAHVDLASNRLLTIPKSLAQSPHLRIVDLSKVA